MWPPRSFVHWWRSTVRRRRSSPRRWPSRWRSSAWVSSAAPASSAPVATATTTACASWHRGRCCRRWIAWWPIRSSRSRSNSLRVLLIKTSSLCDVIHTLPALTDAAKAIPGIRFDWVVEEGFAEIPAWHPAVAQVIPVALRRWRKHLWQTLKNGEWRRFKARLEESRYDLVIDAQGLLKSAWLTRYVKAPVA